MKDGDGIKRKLLSVLLILGMLVALFLVYEHFSESASKYCTFGDSFNCGIVNKSPYANIDGISYLLTIDYGLPLPLIDISRMNVFFDLITSNAVLGFLTLLLLFYLNISNKKDDFLFIKGKDKLTWIRGVLIFSVVYGAFLFYIQHYILKTYCIFCIALDVAMVISLVIAYSIKE